MRAVKRTDAGFTMWEIVIALTMFVLGVMSIVKLIPSLNMAGNRVAKNTEGVFIANMLIADMKKDAATLTDNEFVNTDGAKWSSGGPFIVHTPFPVGEREVLGQNKIQWLSRLTDIGSMYQAIITIYTFERGQSTTQEFITYVHKDE